MKKKPSKMEWIATEINHWILKNAKTLKKCYLKK